MHENRPGLQGIVQGVVRLVREGTVRKYAGEWRRHDWEAGSERRNGQFRMMKPTRFIKSSYSVCRALGLLPQSRYYPAGWTERQASTFPRPHFSLPSKEPSESLGSSLHPPNARPSHPPTATFQNARIQP